MTLLLPKPHLYLTRVLPMPKGFTGYRWETLRKDSKGIPECWENFIPFEHEAYVKAALYEQRIFNNERKPISDSSP